MKPLVIDRDTNYPLWGYQGVLAWHNFCIPVCTCVPCTCHAYVYVCVRWYDACIPVYTWGL